MTTQQHNDVAASRSLRRGIYLIPNLFTLTAMFSGFYTIIMASQGHWEWACMAIFVAMIFGVLFFLFEVYGEDHVLSFIVLCLMWFNEIYSVTTLRSIESTRFFPTVFFFLFSLFHIYFFSFPFGFHLLALWCWMAWNAFACFYFWNFFELPQIAAELL